MIELRILRNGTEGTLQFRRYGLRADPDSLLAVTAAWTEWQDVPVVTESEGAPSDMDAGRA